MMILKTGNKRSFFNNSFGISFVELMVTMIIFSTGIVAIFKSYLLALDRMTYLTNRLNANIILDNRLVEIERLLKVYKALPFETIHNDSIDVGGRTVTFNQQIQIGQVENFLDIFELKVILDWNERNRQINLSRSSYILESPSEQTKK